MPKFEQDETEKMTKPTTNKCNFDSTTVIPKHCLYHVHFTVMN